MSHGPGTNLPPPSSPPRCFQCDLPSVCCVTRRSNRKGNAGRKYFKCVRCRKFLVFADDLGNQPGNPPCECGHSSKREVSVKEKLTSEGKRAWKVYFVCRLGTCDFYQEGEGRGGTSDVLDKVLLERLKNMKIL